MIVTATRRATRCSATTGSATASACSRSAPRGPTSASSTTGRSSAPPTVITDAPAEARLRAADLSETVATGHLDWLEVHGLDELERGELQPLRRPDDVTVYKGVGSARLALAVAAPLVAGTYAGPPAALIRAIASSPTACEISALSSSARISSGSARFVTNGSARTSARSRPAWISRTT